MSKLEEQDLLQSPLKYVHRTNGNTFENSKRKYENYVPSDKVQM